MKQIITAARALALATVGGGHINSNRNGAGRARPPIYMTQHRNPVANARRATKRIVGARQFRKHEKAARRQAVAARAEVAS